MWFKRHVQVKCALIGRVAWVLIPRDSVKRDESDLLEAVRINLKSVYLILDF